MERDSLLLFQEADHRYIYQPTGENFVSGTTFIHHFFTPFQGSKVVDKMMASSNWSKSPYFGRSKSDILDQWKKEGAMAAAAGTLMHSNIEKSWLGQEVNWSAQPVEGAYFEKVKESLTNQGWFPYRLEWRIFTEDYKIAGTLDALFQNKEGQFLLVDWKRCKEFKYTNPWQHALPPIQDLPDCNVIQYSLQLNLYAWILARHYNITVQEMRLYSFHPNLSEPEELIVPLWPERITTMVQSFVM